MLQRISERMEAWPIEDWAASAGRVLRRTRRRLARRKARVAIGVAFAVVVVAVGGNALWSQSGAHPAPLWGQEARVTLAAHGGPAVRQVGPGAVEAEADVGASDMVAELQDGLRAAGYYDGAASGELDLDTVDAIRAFELDEGLPETGEPSVTLLAAVTAAAEAGPVGSSGAPAERQVAAVSPAAATHAAVPSSVADIQRLLNERGFGPLDVDGQMGKRTRQALDSFAAQAGLGARDGLSPEVLSALARGG